MRVIGLTETIDLSLESIGNCKGFFTAYVSSSTSFLAENAIGVLYDAAGHLWEATLTSLLPAVNPVLGYSSGKPVQDQLA